MSKFGTIRKNKNLNDLELISRYSNEDISMNKLSKEYNTSRETIRRIFVKNGIPIKGTGYFSHLHVHSKESREKMSLSAKGRIKSQETINKIVATNIKNGNYEKLSLLYKGKKVGGWLAGEYTASEETRKKIGDANRGRISTLRGTEITEETREKIKLARSKQIIPLQDTSIEIKIQEFLSLLHLEYFAHKYMSEIDYKYRCDIFIPEQEGIPQKTIIECDGCYFHSCPICNKNKKMNPKQQGQTQRDEIRTKELIEKGFRVIRIWEHEIKTMEVNDLKEKLEIANKT